MAGGGATAPAPPVASSAGGGSTSGAGTAAGGASALLRRHQLLPPLPSASDPVCVNMKVLPDGKKRYEIVVAGVSRFVFYDPDNEPYAAAIEIFNDAKKRVVSPTGPSQAAASTAPTVSSSTVIQPNPSQRELLFSSSAESSSDQELETSAVKPTSAPPTGIPDSGSPKKDVKALRLLLISQRIPSPSESPKFSKGKGTGKRSSPAPNLGTRVSGRLRGKGKRILDEPDNDLVSHPGDDGVEVEEQAPPRKKKREAKVSSSKSGIPLIFIIFTVN